jgi:hypothetical protein
MTELECCYLLEHAAGAAEACVELGCPESIRFFILDGYDAAEVRQAVVVDAAPERQSRPTRGSVALDLDRELAVAVAARFAGKSA